MSDYRPETRLLHGSVAAPEAAPGYAPRPSGEVSFRQILGVVRRRYRVILLVAMLGA